MNEEMKVAALSPSQPGHTGAVLRSGCTCTGRQTNGGQVGMHEKGDLV